MVIIIVSPVQPLLVGVTVYTAVPNVDPVTNNVCAIVAPDPGTAPVTPVCATVHENVVPATLLVKEIPVVLPEQIVCTGGIAFTIGFGSTVTVISTGLPEQPVNVSVGVTV